MNKKQNSVTPNFDRIQPQTCVNGKLRRLHRLINSAYMEKFKPFGLRGSMVSILFIIGKQKSIHQKAIAERLVLDQSTMSRDLKKLIDKGWVVKNKGEDSRYSALEMTPAGYALLEEIAPIWEQLHHKVEHILGQFNIQHIDVLIAAIQKNLLDLKA